MLEGLPQQILGGIRLAMVCFAQVAHMPVDNREAGHLRLGLLIGLTLPACIDIDTHERDAGNTPSNAPPANTITKLEPTVRAFLRPGQREAMLRPNHCDS